MNDILQTRTDEEEEEKKQTKTTVMMTKKKHDIKIFLSFFMGGIHLLLFLFFPRLKAIILEAIVSSSCSVQVVNRKKGERERSYYKK